MWRRWNPDGWFLAWMKRDTLNRAIIPLETSQRMRGGMAGMAKSVSFSSKKFGIWALDPWPPHPKPLHKTWNVLQRMLTIFCAWIKHLSFIEPNSVYWFNRAFQVSRGQRQKSMPCPIEPEPAVIPSRGQWAVTPEENRVPFGDLKWKGFITDFSKGNARGKENNVQFENSLWK